MKSSPFILFLKSGNSRNFEYKNNIRSVTPTSKGYRVTFKGGKSYNYATHNVKYYPLLNSQKDVRIYENGQLNRWYDRVDNYGQYLIFRNDGYSSSPTLKNDSIEIYAIKKSVSVDRAKTIIDYFKEILRRVGEVSFEIPTAGGNEKSADQLSAQILFKALDSIDLLEPRSALSSYLNGVNPSFSAINTDT